MLALTPAFPFCDLYKFINYPASSGVQYKVDDYVAEKFLTIFFVVIDLL